MITTALVYPLSWLLRGSNETNDPAAPERATENIEETSRHPERLVGTYRNTTNAYALPLTTHGPDEVFMTHNNDSTYENGAQRRTDNPEIPNDFIPDSETSHVRLLPLVSSIFVPFSILLEVPGLTEYWYIRTNDEHKIVEFQANPIFLRAILGVSITCAIVTNVCLLVRLFEKAVRRMTISCILALTAHGTCFLCS